MKGSIGRAFREKSGEALSPFEAASTALASTVGTGNIVGTAQALCMGGAGALFWMWVATPAGMAVKYAEICLAVKSREPDGEGGYHGGPMYYIRSALGPFGALLAGAYALFAALAGLGMGNMAQLNSAADALVQAAALFRPVPGPQLLRLAFGLLAAGLLLLILSGGAKRVGRAAALLVPFMCLAFCITSFVYLISKFSVLPTVLAAICRSALSPGAFLGASGGMAARAAINWGLRRSAFSNEAGLGTSALAHSRARCNSAVEQGFWGVFEVFADSLICTVTGLCILCSGAELSPSIPPGTGLLTAAFAQTMGQNAARLFVSAAMLLLAFSSVLGWALYGESCARWLLGQRGGLCYRGIFLSATVLGSVLSAKAVWQISDLFNGLMSLPNLLALLFSLKSIGQMSREYLDGL